MCVRAAFYVQSDILFHIVCGFIVDFPVEGGTKHVAMRATVAYINPFHMSVISAAETDEDVMFLVLADGAF